MTFEKAFDSIKKKFDGASGEKVNDFALQVTMSDEDCGGTFYIAVQNGVLSVEPYDYKDNNAMLDISKSGLLALIAGRKSISKVVDEGASLKGDEGVIKSLKAVLKTVPEDAAKAEPAKKEAVKKEAAKKTTTRAARTAKADKAAKTEKTAKAAKTEKAAKGAKSAKAAKKTSK